jgi:3-oxoacyl-[acyl-carrier protein] reductase
MDAKDEEFIAAFQSHVIAAQTLARLCVPGMKTAGFGRIINIISTSVKVPIPNLGVSNTVRAAVANWSKTLSLELGSFGITVNNVLPGFTKTPRLEYLRKASSEKMKISEDEVDKMWRAYSPAGRHAEPSEIAAAILFLASPMASYINGINLPVDGGRTQSL